MQRIILLGSLMLLQSLLVVGYPSRSSRFTTVPGPGSGQQLCTESLCSEPYLDDFMTYEEMVWYYEYINDAFLNIEVLNWFDTALGTKQYIIKMQPYRRFNGLQCMGTPTQCAKKVVWVEGGIDGNNWLSSAVAINYIEYIINECNNVFSGPLPSACFFNYYVVPMVNPDGYTYSRNTDSTWVKNRKDLGSGNVGVNLIRNSPTPDFSSGGSDDPTSNDYRGSYPGSEDELQYTISRKYNTHPLPVDISFILQNDGGACLYPHAYTTTDILSPDFEYHRSLCQQFIDQTDSYYSMNSYAGKYGNSPGHLMDYNYVNRQSPAITIAFNESLQDADRIDGTVSQFIESSRAVIFNLD